MKKRLILHVGHHKTGTTSIQRFLQGSANNLKREGAIYPETGRERAGGDLYEGHHTLADLCRVEVSNPDDFEESKKRFRDETYDYETIILSSEAFLNLSSLDKLATYFDKFQEYELTVMIYLRERLSYLVSSFQQHAQSQKKFIPFSGWAGRPTRMHALISRWQELNDVRFRPYDRDLLIGSDVVIDFLCTAGLTLRPIQQNESNPSIGGNLLYLRLAANMSGVPFLTYNQQRGAAMKIESFRGPFFIADDRARTIRGANQYNEMVVGLVGDLPIRSYDRYPSLPQLTRLEEDISWLERLGSIGTVATVAKALAKQASSWF